MNQITPKMVKINRTEDTISLEELLLSTGQIPISMFGEPSKASIESAIYYLKESGGGSVRVPVHNNINNLVVNVVRDKEGELQVQYIYYNYRPPIGTEERPYTGGEWKSGDIIYNIDLKHSDDKTIYWYCVESGIPGYWNFVSDANHGAYRDAQYIDEEETIVII